MGAARWLPSFLTLTLQIVYSEYTQTILVSSGLFKGSSQLEMLWPHPRRVFLVSVEDRELLPSSSLSLYTYLGLPQPTYQIPCLGFVERY